jgi:hypothetical protein
MHAFDVLGDAVCRRTLGALEALATEIARGKRSRKKRG